MTRKKLARIFWCQDGGRSWITFNVRPPAPRGFEATPGFMPQRIVKNPSGEHLARLERALPKLRANGYIVQKVEPFFHPGSPGGWCAF